MAAAANSYQLVLLVLSFQCLASEVVSGPRETCFQHLPNATTSCLLCPVPPHLRMLYCSGEDAYIHASFVATTATTNDNSNSNINSLAIREVIFGLDRSRGLLKKSVFLRKLPQTVSELNGFFCNESRRQGTLCSRCKDGCGIALYTYYGLPCACPCGDYGILLYFLLEIGFSTLFFALVFFLKISVLSSRWYGVVFYFQTTASFGNTYPIMHTFYEKGGHRVLPVVLDSLHGVWNMDFLRLALPQFCVSQHVGTLGAISTGYISALWPLFLVVLISLALRLHKRDYKIVVYPWRVVNKISAGVIQRRFRETNLIKTFATFLLLSYLKLMYVSFALLGTSTSYNVSPDNSSVIHGRTFSLDPEVPYGSRKHLKYAIPAFVIVLFVGILLPLGILLYPMKCVQRLWGERVTGRFWLGVKTFIEAFHGGFKDGTAGTRDYRPIPALTAFSRVFFAMMYSLRGAPVLAYNLPLFYVAIAFYGLVKVAIFGLGKPYKTRRHNLIDVLLWALVAVECLFISAMFEGEYDGHVMYTLVVLAFLPATAVAISVEISIFKYLIAQRN